MSKILFINASEHEKGGTDRFGRQFLAGKDYTQADLVKYKIYQLGQHFADDQFAEVFNQMVQADTLVLGTPVYWHTISAYLKTLMERVSQLDPADVAQLRGKRVFLLVQGADPSDTIGPADKLVGRFCQVLGLDYAGAATPRTAAELSQQI